MIAFFWNLLFFVIALGILVAVHEWGHFIVARLCGVKVHRFSVGFGKVLFSRKDKKGTEFVLSAIPLGGYVQMLDSRVDTVAQDQQQYAFNNKSVAQRMSIIAAGPAINLLFAVLVLCVMYMIGVDKVRPIIGSTAVESIAYEANIPSGAQIVAVNGNPTIDWNKVNLEMIAAIGSEQMNIEIQPESYSSTKNVQLDLTNWNFDVETQSVVSSLGIVPFQPEISTVISVVQAGQPAEQSDIRVGDKITAIDGDSDIDWQQFVMYVRQHAGKDIQLALLRDQETLIKTVKVGKRTQGDTDIGYLGVMGTQEAWPDGFTYRQQLGLFDGLWQGLSETWRLTTLSFALIGKLLTGDLSVNTLSGPISIAQGAGTSASYGLVYFLSFLALVSVNLGVINLLPLPVLDGGHLVYFIVEWLKGSPVSENIQQIGYRIGAALVLMIMLIAVFNDLGRI